MREVFVEDLARVGREVAEAVAGAEAVKAKVGLDYEGETVYRFTFLIEPKPDGLEGALLRGRVSMAVRDALMERNDDHYPFVRLISRAEWDARKGA